VFFLFSAMVTKAPAFLSALEKYECLHKSHPSHTNKQSAALPWH